MFRFTSTTLHVILNVRKAIYLHKLPIQLIHATCKNIAMITPLTDITFDNSLTESDIDVGDLRRQIEKSDTLVSRNKDDKSTAEYYKRGNSKSKPALRKLCEEEGIAFMERNTRNELAESLASSYRKKSRDNSTKEQESTSLQRKQAFMNRMIKHWFMHPFTTHSNSDINDGKENKSLTLKYFMTT